MCTEYLHDVSIGAESPSVSREHLFCAGGWDGIGSWLQFRLPRFTQVTKPKEYELDDWKIDTVRWPETIRRHQTYRPLSLSTFYSPHTLTPKSL